MESQPGTMNRLNEPCHEKTCFCICENKGADQLCGNRAADQTVCFSYFQASSYLVLLSHLSQRLIGELLVYRGIRRPSVVRPSSTFSNDFFSEAAGPILLIFYI